MTSRKPDTTCHIMISCIAMLHRTNYHCIVRSSIKLNYILSCCCVLHFALLYYKVMLYVTISYSIQRSSTSCHVRLYWIITLYNELKQIPLAPPP